MAGASVEHFEVEAGCGGARRSRRKSPGKQLGLQVADQSGLDEILVDEAGRAAKIDRGDGERLIHGHDEVAGAIDAAAVAEGLVEQLAEDDANVLDAVVLIDVEIAVGLEIEVEARVWRTASSMWSRKRIPVEMVVAAPAFDASLPRIWVSLVSRWMVADLTARPPIG